MSNLVMAATGTSPVSGPLPDEAPPVAFHRIGRTSARYRWWRPVLGTVLVLGGTVAAMVSPRFLLTRVAGYHGDLPVLGPLTDLVLQLAGIVLALPVVLAVTRWIGARPAGTLTSVQGQIRWRRLGVAVLYAVPVSVAVLTGAVLLTFISSPITATAEPARAGTPTIAGSTLVTLGAGLAVVSALTVVQAVTEEVITRGWILQGAGSFSRSPWPAIGVQSIVFTILHGVHGTVWGYADLIGYSLIVGWLAVSTGGIEAGIALHAVWNLIIGFFTVIAVVILGINQDSGASIAGGGWQILAVHLPGVAVYALAVWWTHRRLTRTAVPGQPSRPGPATAVS